MPMSYKGRRNADEERELEEAVGILKENGTSMSCEERQKKEEDKSWDEMQGYEKNEEAPKRRRREK